MKYNIYPIPFEVRGLEYLNLLHKHTAGMFGGDTYCIQKFSWRLLYLPARNDERRVVHIHWETNIYGSRFALLSLMRMTIRFPGLWLLKLRRLKIFWTMHNLAAHDYPHPKIDRIGKMIMWQLADTINIQEEAVAREQALKHPQARVVCIPQGNYVGIYGPLWTGDREALRASHGVKPGEIVLLSLGSIRPYKALPQLIDVVTGAYERGAPLKLIITGKASQEYADIITAKVGNNPAIILKIGFVPDEKIPEMLALADYTIFYYEDSSLSSAAMILSLSYGTPVITRDIPASAMIVPGKSGFVFHSAADLEEILLGVASISQLDRGGIIESVASQHWPSVAAKLRGAYAAMWEKK